MVGVQQDWSAPGTILDSQFSVASVRLLPLSLTIGDFCVHGSNGGYGDNVCDFDICDND